MKNIKNYAIILASGKGVRCNSDIPKQFIKIEGKTILEHTIDVFEKTKKIDEIIIIITPSYKDRAEKILKNNAYKKISKLINGGETRKESSYIGISAIEDKEANVLIHDCARPFVTEKIINECIEKLNSCVALEVAIECVDTIIKVGDNNIIQDIPPRENLLRVQTPQGFKLSVIKKAHELSKNISNFTDDCSLIFKYNLGTVHIIKGDIDNIKITYPEDIIIADRIFKKRLAELTSK